MGKLSNKVAIVTGAAQGISLGIARVLVAERASVILSDVNDTVGLAATAELTAGDRAAYLHSDVTREDEVRQLIATTMVRFGRLDIVVNNAGVVAVQTVEESTIEDWDRVMAINVRLTKSLALDYAPERIRVNCICPGITDMPMLRYHARHAADPEAHLRHRLERVPTSEMLCPEDIGRAAAFLCSDEAAGITGTSLIVDGGYIACAEFYPKAGR